jgi:alanine racemase
VTPPLREARIDVGAIARNVAAISAHAGGTPAMVIVKANGYGHGAVESARAALDGGAAWLGVVDVDEALELRYAGITAPVLAWIHDPTADFDEAISRDIDLGVNYLEQLERVAAAEGRANVQLKLDTGLGRNGVVESEWAAVFARAAALEAAGAIRVRGIFSHLSSAGPVVDESQLGRFEAALAQAAGAGLTPEFVHLTATGGSLTLPAGWFSMLRIGIGAYGLTPFEEGEGVSVTLTPAMRVSAGVISVKRVPAGTGLSYGHSYVTDRETTLALVPLGYADGVPRHASNAGPVSINGTTYRVSGRIAMDQFIVDVGDDAVALGDRAVLFGDPADGVPSADDWAAAAGTINYEIVTRIGARVVRRYER